jgi:hypothetical protein
LILLSTIPAKAASTESPQEVDEVTATSKTVTDKPAPSCSEDGHKSLEGSHTIIQPTNVYREQEDKGLKRKTYRSQDIRRVEKLYKHLHDFLACIQQGLPDCEQKLDAAIKCEQRKGELANARKCQIREASQTLYENRLQEEHGKGNAEPIMGNAAVFHLPYDSRSAEQFAQFSQTEPCQMQQQLVMPDFPVPLCCQSPVITLNEPVQELQLSEPLVNHQLESTPTQFSSQFQMIPFSPDAQMRRDARQEYLSPYAIPSSLQEICRWREEDRPWLSNDSPDESQRITLN